MLRSALLCSLGLALGIPPAHPTPALLTTLSLDQLEQRRREIDAQLQRIATYSLGHGLGAIGYRSPPHDSPHAPEWIEIDLGEIVALDELVLVPTIRRDAMHGFQADGFPASLRVVAGVDPDRRGTTLADYGPPAHLLPRIAPLVIPGGGTLASWIRIEARVLSPRAFDGKHVFQLAEVLAFRGPENIALRRPVKIPGGENLARSPGWSPAFLTDGVLPYLMAAADGKKSVAYLSQHELGEYPAITVDLGESRQLSGVQLHAVDQSDTVPQAFAGDVGVPKILRITGATQPDFSDGTVLIELHHASIYDVGPILSWSFPETRCRFVRLTAVERAANSFYGQSQDRLGFAEIELFESGRNVALHQPVTANFPSEPGIRRLSTLTDGLNYYGSILPLRDWLNQLATRHELENERPLIVAELNARSVRQRAQFVQLAWLAALLGCGVVGVVVAGRLQRRRAIAQTRTRIAADLHDELGADLHAIGLLTDLASRDRASAEKLADLLQRMRALTERAGQAARHCTNLLEAPGLFGDLAEDVRRTSSRILADLDHAVEINDAEALQKLDPQRRIDLLLFYQECLINIIRHSGATRVRAHLAVDHGRLHLRVADNGQGLQGALPASLKRRARLLRAQLDLTPAPAGGLQIDLRFRLRRWKLFS